MGSVFLNPDNLELKIPADNPKFIWPIPFDAIKNTPALATQQNPGFKRLNDRIIHKKRMCWNYRS